MSNLFADTNTAPVKPRSTGVVVAKPVSQAFSIQVLNGSKRTDEKFASSEAK
jgi:hypothetical protein